MQAIKAIEPRVNVKAEHEQAHVVVLGGERITASVNTADSWGSVGATPIQASFTVHTPSERTITDRDIKIKCYFTVTVDADLQLGTNDALRQFPIASLMDVLTTTIDGENISDNIADKAHALLCYGNDHEARQGMSSTSPSMPDNYQDYADWGTYGSAKNPLADYGESPFDPRGGFPVVPNGLREFAVEVTESLLMSPFSNGLSPHDEGFVNVQKFGFNIRWKANLSRILSHSSLGNAVTVVNVSMYKAPEILCTFITPQPYAYIPRVQVLPYYKSMDFIKQVPVLAPGASTTIFSDSVKLSQIPSRMYLFCRHERSTFNQNSSDSFLNISRVSVLWNNQSGLLSSATEQDLFNISRSNGCNLSWAMWHKHRGSVLCIDFGKDIGLAPHEAPGVSGAYSLQIQLDVKNVSAANFTAEFYTLFMMQGSISIAPGQTRAMLGNLPSEVVLATIDGPELPAGPASLTGGSFWSSLKHFVHTVSTGISKGVGVAEKLAPVLMSAFPEFAPEIGAVAGVLPAVGRGASTVSSLTGGRMSGGQLTRAQLKKMTR